MNYRSWMLIGVIALLVTSTTFAAEDAAKLDHQLCMSCHSAAGKKSSKLFPQLAGEPAPYFINQMKAFRNKSRADENSKKYMWDVAAKLTDENIQQLAAFYEAQPALHLRKVTDQAKYDFGKNIFLNGRRDKGIPACMACHGEKGEGKDTVPRLGGQNEGYLKQQLMIFYSNERPAAIAMHEIVKGLSECDIESIAQYLQAQ